MEKYPVSIVIPNYNGIKLLKKNLPQVVTTAKQYKADIVMVDDASTDTSIEFVRRNYPQIQLITLKKNSGFSTAANTGISKAKGEIVILLNHDVTPEKDFLNFLLPYFEDPEIFAVGCLQKCYEDGRIIQRGRGIGTFNRGFLAHSRGEVNQHNTLWVSGGAGAFRKSIWQLLGGFDTLFNPFYWEDIDLSYRALKAGYKIAFEAKSVVLHNQSEGAIRTSYNKFDIKTITYRNQFIFFWKNITQFKILLTYFFWFPYHFAKAIISLDLPFVLGFFSALLRLPKIAKSRSELSILAKKKDEDVVAPFNSNQ